MSWRKGFFRLWVLFTVLWAGFSAWLPYIENYNYTSENILVAIGIAIAVPAALLALGAVLAWGFRQG